MAAAAILLVASLALVPARSCTAPAAADSPPPVEARFPVGAGLYLTRETGARADPVNLVFRAADTAIVQAAVARVLGWPPVEGSAMTFDERTGLHPTALQVGVDLAAGSRLHLRVEAVGLADAQEYVLAAVHRDDPVACGHVGRAFDDTRDLVARAFAVAGAAVALVEAGNTASGPHCDGSQTPGDGRVAIITLPAAPAAVGQ